MSKITRGQARNVKGSTDWKKVETLTDKDVRKAALADPTAKPLTEFELMQFRPLKFIKHKLGL